MIRAKLCVLLSEATKQNLLFIANQIAIVVRQITDLSFHCYDHAIFPGLQTGGEKKLIGENRYRFKKTVSI